MTLSISGTWSSPSSTTKGEPTSNNWLSGSRRARNSILKVSLLALGYHYWDLENRNANLSIEELQNALDEIKKNEKDTNMIAMLANTLFERTNELQSKLMEAETQLADQQTQASIN